MVAWGAALVYTLISPMLTHSDPAVSSVEKDDLERMSVYTDALCPYNVMCREGGPRRTVPEKSRRQWTGCCTDCSCADDCGLFENCCYPQLDRYTLVDRSHQQCIYPTTNQLQDGTAYNMVVDGYPHHVREEVTPAETTCGDDVTASRVGAVYPVFSPKTGRIYVNMKCARVHGLGTADVVTWQAYLACEDSMFIDVSTYFQYFANGIMTPSCTFKFIYPGPKSDLQTEKCYPGADIGICPNNEDFKISDALNMTHREVVDACKSDLTSPVLRASTWYKNVFCGICAERQKEYLPMRICAKSDTIDDHRMLKTSFLALLDEHVLGQGSATAQTHSIVRKACSVTNESNCRLAYCPSGKILDVHGQCRYVSDHWRTGSVGMNLKLIPRHPVTLSTARDTDFATLLTDPLLSVSPWSSSWTVERLLTFPRTDAENVTHVQYFLVRLRYEKPFNPEPVLGDINDAPKHDWFLFLNNYLLGHSQEFSKFKSFVEATGENTERSSSPDIIYLNKFKDALYFMKSIPVPEFEILYGEGVIQPLSVILTQMFFCDQVLLEPGEYQMDPHFNFVRLNATGRIFYPSEVAVAYDEELESAPRVCSHDVGYHVVSPTAGVARLVATSVWWVVGIQTLYSTAVY